MKNLNILFMVKRKIKKKLVFLGDPNSINIELITKSFNFLKNRVHYILICNKKDLFKSQFFKNSKIKINEILDPLSFDNYDKNFLNIFNVENISNRKDLILLNQIKICNELANFTNLDLVTMPVSKALFKKKNKFIGMTEYLGQLNKRTTVMLMSGDKFSIIPITTHINLKNIYKIIEINYMSSILKKILTFLKDSNFNKSFKEIKFLCYNPHCGEEGSLGKEDILIKKLINKFKKIKGPYPADSAFNKIDKGTLFISTYHDQALIPFKILNKKSVNMTLGLNYRRLSPTHGTATNIKKKYIANNESYLTCLLF